MLKVRTKVVRIDVGANVDADNVHMNIVGINIVRTNIVRTNVVRRIFA
jgi:hypothetical protein